MTKTLLNLLNLTFITLLLNGCAGYQIGDVKPSAYAGIDRIAVPVFRNQTLEPRISSLVTNAVIKRIQQDGTYKVTRREDADAVLVGTIERIRKQQLRGVRTDNIRASEFGVFLYVRWHLEDSSGEKISNFGETPEEAERQDEIEIGSETVRVSPGVVVGNTIQNVDPSFQVSERNAIAVAAEDAAKKLVHQISEGW